MVWWRRLALRLGLGENPQLQDVLREISEACGKPLMLTSVDNEDNQASVMVWSERVTLSDLTMTAYTLLQFMHEAAAKRAQECPCPGCSRTLADIEELLQGFNRQTSAWSAAQAKPGKLN